MSIWIDKLSIVSLGCLLPRLIFAKGTLRYLSSTATGEALFRGLKRSRLLRLETSEIAWNLGDLKDKEGRSLRFSIEARRQDIMKVAEAAVRRIIGDLDSQPLARLPVRWVSQSLCFDLHGALRPRLTGFMVIEALRRSGDVGPEDTVFVSRMPFDESFRAFAMDQNPHTKSYGGGFFTVVLPTWSLLVEAIRTLVQVILAFAQDQRPTRHRADRLTIAVEYCWGIDDSRRNDLYWIAGSGIDPDQVLLYFDRNDAVLTPELVSEMRRRGYRWVVRSRQACEVNGQGVWKPGFKDRIAGIVWIARLVKEATLWPASLRFGDWVWLLARGVWLLRDLSYWWCFFYEHRVVAHANHSGLASVTHSVQSLALHMNGGINFRTTYSYHSFLNPQESGDFHLFFAWGPCPGSSPGALAYVGRSMNIVVTGYPFGGLAESAISRDDLMALTPGPVPKFILGVFDEPFGQLLEYSPSIWRGFYAGISRWVMPRSDVLAVMKPKDITVKDIVSQVPDAARALEAGRVVVLDRDTHVSEVARHSDIVVGLGISTASVEAAMLGVPAVHYDPSMRVNAQMHERARHTIVFSELESLLDELGRFVDGARDLSIGDHAGVIEEIDPFRDGNAAGRIGVYLTNYVLSLEGGFDRDQALDAANQAYMARWGTDKVSVSRLQDS